MNRFDKNSGSHSHIDPKLGNRYTILFGTSYRDSDSKLALPLKGAMFVEQPLLHANPEPNGVRVHVPYITPKRFFLTVLRCQPEGLQVCFEAHRGCTHSYPLPSGGI